MSGGREQVSAENPQLELFQGKRKEKERMQRIITLLVIPLCIILSSIALCLRRCQWKHCCALDIVSERYLESLSRAEHHVAACLGIALAIT